MKKRFRSDSGFTLVELAVVLVLIGLAAALVLPLGLQKAANSAALETEAQKLSGTIRLARQKSIAQSVPGSVYGVRFEDTINASFYRLFAVNTGTGGTIWAGKKQDLDKHVIMDTVSHLEITFNNIGVTGDTGTVRFKEKGGSNRTISLEVNSLGTVDIR